MQGGEKDSSYTGLVKYYDTWYYVKDGVLDWSYTGLTKYYGTWYYVYGGIFAGTPILSLNTVTIGMSYRAVL